MWFAKALFWSLFVVIFVSANDHGDDERGHHGGGGGSGGDGKATATMARYVVSAGEFD